MNIRAVFLAAVWALQVAAQNAAPDAVQEKVTVALSDPSQPVTIKARVMRGSISLVGGGSQVVVESQESPGGSRVRAGNRESAPPAGMKRIAGGAPGLEVTEDHNVVTIGAAPWGANANLSIQVPVNASVQLKSISGDHVDVSGINGDIGVDGTNGSVNLKDVSGAVVVHTINGSVTVTLDKVAPNKPMSFTSLNGKIDVTLPGDTKAQLRLKTTNGAVYSDFEVKMESDAGNPSIDDARGKGGKNRIRVTGRGVSGSINGGGPEFVFQTMNGDILIHKK